jgi:Ribosome 60S biogenesis N-terminal
MNYSLSGSFKIKYVYDLFSLDCSTKLILTTKFPQNNVQALETSILDVIKLFLDLCHSPVIRSSGVSLIRRILQQQLRYIYRNLTAPRIMLQHSTLRLLISMNSFSASTTREMLDTFNFQLNVMCAFVMSTIFHFLTLCDL